MDSQSQHAPGPPEILQILYMSRASREMSDSDIAAILASSRRRNEQTGVSGLLVYRLGKFLQLIEGPAATVKTTYARIKVDPRHDHIIDQLETVTTKRLFASWGMAYGVELISESHAPKVYTQLDAAMENAALSDKVILAILSHFAKNA